jgi:hypothetical protein
MENPHLSAPIGDGLVLSSSVIVTIEPPDYVPRFCTFSLRGVWAGPNVLETRKSAREGL